MRVLVIGAGGFLGRHVCRAFEDAGAQVQGAPPSRELDLGRADTADWDRLLASARPEVLVNCAGRTSGSTGELTRANDLLVACLIDAAGRADGRPRLLHLGSAAELGPTPAELIPEEYPARPTTPYGATKLAGTRLLLGALERAELEGSVLRVFNPVGPGQSLDSLPGRAAQVLADACEEGRPAVRFGPLNTFRDYIDVRDVAQAAVCLARSAHPPRLVNVARGMAVQSRALVNELVGLAGYAGRVEEDAAPSGRSAATHYQQADVSRLRALGWAPQFPLQTTLYDLWTDHLASRYPSIQALAQLSNLGPQRKF